MTLKKIAVIMSIALVSIFMMNSADAHLAKDEVARHGPAGFSDEQYDHQHPHNRIIWYQAETANYTGSPIDLYENNPPPQQTEIIVIENVLERDIPQVVMFDLKDANVKCHDGSGHNKVTSYMRGGVNEIVWSSTYTELPIGQLFKSDSSRADDLLIVWGNVDQVSDTFHLIGIMQSSNVQLCEDKPLVFAVDIHGNCDGSGLNMTSRHPQGYDITATGNQVHAACIP